MKNWFNDNCKYERKITIDHSKVSGDFFFFPFILKLDSNNFDFSKTKTDGSDICFSNSTKEVWLFFQKVVYDVTNEIGIFIINIPKLDSVNDLDIFMYYGNDNPVYPPIDTNKLNSYYHIHFPCMDYSTTSIKDIFTNEIIATKNDSSHVYEDDGFLYKSQYFDGSGLALFDNPDPLKKSKFTIEMLIKIPDTPNNNACIISCGRCDTGGWSVRTQSDKKIKFNWYDGNQHNLYSSPITSNEWHYITFVLDGSNAIGYIDGVPSVTSVAADITYDTNYPDIQFGKIFYWSDPYYKGHLEMFRFSFYPRSSNYVLQVYNNLFGNMVQIGNENEYPTKIYIKRDEGINDKIGIFEKNTNQLIQKFQYFWPNIQFTEIMEETNVIKSQSQWVNCDGLENLFIKSLFSDLSDTSVDIRIVVKDYNNYWSYSKKYTITNTGILDTNSPYYLGELFKFNVSAIKDFGIRLESSPSGNIKFEVGIDNISRSFGINGEEIGLFFGAVATSYDYTTNSFKNLMENTTNINATSPGAGRDGDKNIVAGYATSWNGNYEARVNLYNSKLNIWVVRNNFPPPARSFFGFTTKVLNGKLYLTGGYYYTGSSSDCIENSIISDVWVSKANIPEIKNAHTNALVNGKIYNIAGSDSTKSSGFHVYEYTPTSDTWANKTNMPQGRKEADGSEINDKIYISGGRDQDAGVLLKDNYEYIPSGDTWNNKTDMPSPERSQVRSMPLNNKHYTFSGQYLAIYNPTDDTWVQSMDIATNKYYIGVANTP